MALQTVELITGSLRIEDNGNLDSLIGFGSRANPKRGFLFVSKVLGKHIPSRPSQMKQVHQALADKISPHLLHPDLSGSPTVIIGLAETATGIGYGVYEALKIPDSFYWHTTRYALDAEQLVRFQEEHSHAPSHILYNVQEPHLADILNRAQSLVLVDDEVTTGKTIRNLVKALKQRLPNIQHYFGLSVLNWMSKPDEAVHYETLHHGEFEFSPLPNLPKADTVSFSAEPRPLDSILPHNFGRFGIQDKRFDFAQIVNIEDYRGKRTLVLGTGEFMVFSYQLGCYLEARGIDVFVQSTTRSPIHIDSDIHSKLAFKDNYFENIDNFLYNVTDQAYDKIVVCYETSDIPENHLLIPLLKTHFSDVKPLFVS